MQINRRLIIGQAALTALIMMASTPAMSNDDDAEDRIKALEKQLQILSQELTAMKQQLVGGKEAKAAESGNGEQSRRELNTGEQGRSTARPVLAAFKDGITFEGDSGNWKMAINGRVQADYRQFSPDEDAADTFSLRRARLGATMTFYKDYAVRVEGEYSGGSTQLTYGYVE